MIERIFRNAGGLLWHYREGGSGPPLVLLHPSPRSSAMYVPWMERLAPHFRVLAIDTPGYGGSQPLPQPPASLRDYIGPLRALLREAAGPRFMIYGSATGAQIGIAYALAHPADVQHLLIDNAAHFDDDERAAILAQYFPDLTPQTDGRHLQTAWQMCTQMLQFFPWFAADEAHRIAPGPPAASDVQAAFTELLAAGPGYAAAYRAAFAHERAEHVQALKVPATVLRWRASILLKHIDRLLSFPLPANVQVLEVPAAMAARYAAMTDHLKTLR